MRESVFSPQTSARSPSARFGRIVLAGLLVLAAAAMMRTVSAADPAPGDRAATVTADPAKVSPDIYKVAFENEHTRVLQVTLKSDSKATMAYMAPHLLMATDPGRVKLTDNNGNSQEIELKVGELTWHEAGSHSIENLGHTGTKFIIIEYKDANPRENTAGFKDRDDTTREPARP